MIHQNNRTAFLQKKLGNFCRNGENSPRTTINNNTQYYRDLVFNVVNDTLETSFPIARKSLGKKKWKKIVTHFFSSHACRTPILWKLPLEFYQFYKEESFPLKKDIFYLNDLLYFEWMETEVYMMQDLLAEGDFSDDKKYGQNIIIGNPEVKVLSLHYPVHIKRSEDIKAEDYGQYFVSIHRGYDDKQVYFNNLSYPYVEMLLKVHETDSTVTDLEKVLSAYESDVSIIKKQTNAFLDFCLQQQLILGFKKTIK